VGNSGFGLTTLEGYGIKAKFRNLLTPNIPVRAGDSREQDAKRGASSEGLPLSAAYRPM